MREEIVSLQWSVLKLKKAALLLTVGWIATLAVWIACENSLKFTLLNRKLHSLSSLGYRLIHFGIRSESHIQTRPR